GTEHRRKNELHDRVERSHCADERRHVPGMGDILQQRRQDWKDQPDAHGIEDNGGEDDNECTVHGVLRSARTRNADGRLELATRPDRVSGVVSLKTLAEPCSKEAWLACARPPGRPFVHLFTPPPSGSREAGAFRDVATYAIQLRATSPFLPTMNDW